MTRRDPSSIEEYESRVIADAKRRRLRAAKDWLSGRVPDPPPKDGTQRKPCGVHEGKQHAHGLVIAVEDRRGKEIGLFCKVCGSSIDAVDLREWTGSDA